MGTHIKKGHIGKGTRKGDIHGEVTQIERGNIRRGGKHGKETYGERSSTEKEYTRRGNI